MPKRKIRRGNNLKVAGNTRPKTSFMLTYPYHKGEEEIAKYPRSSYRYALYIKGRFRLGEEAMSLDGDIAFHYACRILKNRFLLGERAIAKDPVRWERYKEIFGVSNKAKVNWKKEGF